MKLLIYVPFAPRGGSLKNLRQLLTIWSQDEEGEMILAARADTHCALGDISATRPWSQFTIPDRALSGWRRVWFERSHAGGLLNHVGADVIFAPGGTVPRGVDAPVVANFQNLLPIQRNLWSLTRDVPLYVRQRGLRIALRSALQSSHAQIFNSENARREFTRFAGRPLPRAEVIPRAMETPLPDREAAQALRSTFGIGDDYMISVGQIFAYRNYLPLLHGVRRLIDQAGSIPPLLLVGAMSSNPEFRRIVRARDRLGLADQVLLPGELPYPVVLGLLAQARLNLFTSSVENCPNALLEAMALGTPSICARASSNPEFGQDGVVYVNAHEPGEWQHAMARMLNDAPLRNQLVTRGKHIAARAATPEFIARQTWRLLEKVANEPRLSSRN